MARITAQTEIITLDDFAAPAAAADLRYDYSLIAVEHRQTIQSSASQIKRSLKRASKEMLETGRLLNQAKDLLHHGQFTEWLRTEFEGDLSDRIAQMMMNAADQFATRPEAANLFSPTSLYLLASPSTPEPARQEAIETAKQTGKSPSKAETQAIIQRHRPQPDTTQARKVYDPVSMFPETPAPAPLRTLQPHTLTEVQTFTLLRNALDGFPDPQDKFQWLSTRQRAADCDYLLLNRQRLDSQVYARVRAQLLSELRQTPQKPAGAQNTRSTPITHDTAPTQHSAPTEPATKAETAIDAEAIWRQQTINELIAQWKATTQTHDQLLQLLVTTGETKEERTRRDHIRAACSYGMMIIEYLEKIR